MGLQAKRVTPGIEFAAWQLGLVRHTNPGAELPCSASITAAPGPRASSLLVEIVDFGFSMAADSFTVALSAPE